jgi:DNA replication protein DnaC
MADGLEQQMVQPLTHEERSFEERLALLVDREGTHRDNNKITRSLKAANLKLQAYPEDIDYSHPRRLQKSPLADLLSSHWGYQHHNVLLTGPTG